MKLSIIILNYRTPRLTIKCLKSLYKFSNDELKNSKYEIILVDNNSGDDSIKKIEKAINKYKWKIIFIKSKSNRGFGGGCNLGVEKSRGNWLLFINSDATVRKNSLQMLTASVKNHNGIDILGPMILNDNKTIQESCAIFPRLFHSLMIFAGLGRKILVRTFPSFQEIDWVSGACMLFNRKVFVKLKGFDEKIFMYLEDMEICYRAKQEKFKIGYDPTIKINHSEGKSSDTGFVITHSYKSYMYFQKKHESKLRYNFLKTLFAFKFKMYYFIGKVTNNNNLIKIYSEI